MTTNEAPPSEKPEIASASHVEGQKLAGCYVLKKRMSGGDAGDLWDAFDEVLGKDISLQFIPDKVRTDQKALGDVRQEIKRNRQLIHPNILRVYDFIEEPDWAAVSMDTFEGKSLDSLIAAKPDHTLSPKEIEPWIFQLCQTLDDAHKIGLLHRNICPANIFFRSTDSLFLTGFGFSRCINDAIRRIDGVRGADAARLSPQLLDGQAALRSDDIYSCGALLYELLTGAPLFSGDDLTEQIRSAVPKPLSEVRKRELDPLPANWEKTIAACLSKNPSERPTSAAHLAKLLAVSSSDARESAPVAAAEAAVSVAAPAAAVAAEAAAKAAPAPAAEIKETKEGKEVKEAPAQKAAPAESPALKKRSISTTAEPISADAGPVKSTSEKPASTASPGLTKPLGTKPPTKTKPVKQEPYTGPYKEKSGFPALGFAVAVAFIVVGIIGFHYIGSHKGDAGGTDIGAATPGASSGAVTPPPEGVSNPPIAVDASQPTATPAPNANPPSEAPDNGGKTAAADSGEKPATPPPHITPPVTPPPVAPASPAEAALAQKQAALDAAKAAAQESDKSFAQLTTVQQQIEADVSALHKSIDDKTKSQAPARKAVEELLTKRKKLEADQKTAEAAAQQAQQLADEKQKLALAAKQVVDDFTTKNQDKLSALDKTDSEIAEMKKALEEKQQIAAQGAKSLSEATAARQKQLDAVKNSEQDVVTAKAALADLQKNREAKEAEKAKLDQEVADLKKLMDEKLKEIERKRKQLEGGAAAPEPATPSATPVSKTPDKPASTPRSKSVSVASPAPLPDLAPLPKSGPDLARLTHPDQPSPDAILLSTPTPTPAPVPVAIQAGGNMNSLGQRFVPIGDVDFCIWQTRVQDYEKFAEAVNLKSIGWKKPGFSQGPDHPVVNVTWHEAMAFCKWLTDKEHKDGVLSSNQYYRLPTDLEWSKAVGLPEEPGKTPADRDMVISDVYPWGKEWPPPVGAGNYTGEETQSDASIKGYNDGFAWTSPVGSFKPNKYGLYDMGGNVWQWCMDNWDGTAKGKVLRGASWYNGALKLSLLSSCRIHAPPDSCTDNYGFRIVKATEGSHATRK